MLSHQYQFNQGANFYGMGGPKKGGLLGGGMPMQPQQEGPKKIGDFTYNPRYCLGEGAFGKVYEGIDTRNNSKVAIKKLDMKTFSRDPYLHKQIISEIQILRKFNHPNIVKFIEMISTQNSLYIVTEFCKDGDLRNYLKNRKPTEEQAIKILKQILAGFAELQKNNVTHRDLKPANILIHEGVIKICDFGFAKYMEKSSTQMLRTCAGSPLYMAPQVMNKQPYTAKCDIWSLGIILHEMIFGETPYQARDERELLNKVMNTPYRMKHSNISTLSKDFLMRSIMVDENKRISWDQAFEMFKIKEFTLQQLQQQQQQQQLPPSSLQQQQQQQPSQPQLGNKAVQNNVIQGIVRPSSSRQQTQQQPTYNMTRKRGISNKENEKPASNNGNNNIIQKQDSNGGNKVPPSSSNQVPIYLQKQPSLGNKSDSEIEKAREIENQGMKLFKEEKMEDALKLLNQALPIKEKYFGDSHLKVANTKYFIGLIYKFFKQNDLAINHLACSLSIYEEKLGSQDKQTLRTRQILQGLQ